MLLLPALLGLTVALAACGASQAGSAAGQSAASAKAASSGATSASSPRPATTSSSPATTPATPPSPSPAPSTSAPAPGVVADCLSSANLLSVRPAIITLACADNGWGVEKMTWASWSTSAAMGHGTFWEKLCKPNCATGKIGTYPVTVTLSAVRTSPGGPWFSILTVTWDGNRPPNPTPSRFRLTSPSA